VYSVLFVSRSRMQLVTSANTSLLDEGELVVEVLVNGLVVGVLILEAVLVNGLGVLGVLILEAVK
jgi:hypothetical protein